LSSAGRGEKGHIVNVVRAIPATGAIAGLLALAGSVAPAAAQTQTAPEVITAPAREQAPASTGLQLSLPAGTFLGGVPSGTKVPGAPTITILDAMSRALEHNLGVLTAEDQIGRARGTRWKELSNLLPNVIGRVSEMREEINLQALGFGSGTFGPAFADVPPVIGPFNVFDARVFVSQSIFDRGALNHTRSEEHNVAAARYIYRGARDFVVWVAGNLYLHALASNARADAAHAQQDTAQALYNQALDLRQAGIVAGIDVLRAEVQLNAEKQRATAASNDAEKAKLVLARVMGLPIGQDYTLDANLPELPRPDMTLEQAVEQAQQSRADYQAALERIKAAESARQAVIGEALPAVRVNADFGEIGNTPAGSRGTFTVVGAVNVPIFQGGRTKGRLLETEADLRGRRQEADDLKGAIYYEVRAAFLDLQATNEQLQVAGRARDLAAQQLTQSRDRFAAGVANNIEVVQAQEAVAVANQQYIDALYGYALAKGALLRGIGTAEQTLRQYLGGNR
jgi:outer membrane protein TolC